MPVSNPSYFPSVRNIDRIVGLNAGLKQTGNYVFLAGLDAGNGSTVDDLIVIGSSALSSGNENNPGTIVLGVNAAEKVLYYRNSEVTIGSVIIGDNAYVNSDCVDSSVMIGANCFNAFARLAGGNEQGAGASRTVAIGVDIYATGKQTNPTGPTDSVLVGYGIFNDPGAGSTISTCVLIGSRVNSTSINLAIANSVIIGYEAGGGCSTGDTAVGSGAMNQINSALASNNVALGYNAGQNIEATSGGTYLGYDSGIGLGDHQNVLAIATGGGHAIIGLGNPQSTGGTNLAFGSPTYAAVSLASAVNTYFFANGTPASVDPTGGGYFYVTGGVLHWVDSSGTDTQITVSASGQLASTSVGYTNNAGAAAGTLTNAPAAGNPTKWIPINDNGTIRNIPAW